MYTPFVPNINVTYLGLVVGKHSLLTTLFDMKFINKRIFQIERENIIIGGFNNTIRTQSFERSNLTYTDIRKYSCLLHKIDLSYPSFSKTETGMAKAIFKSDYDNMSIPHSYWFFFKKYYLKDHLLQNKCKYLESMYAIKVKCLSDVKMLLPDVKLTFDNAELVLTPDDLFNSDVVDSDKRILFRIDFVTDITHWALGIFFIKKFRMIFNTEDGILQLVTEINMNNNETHANQEMIRLNATIIGFILICILTVGISFNVYVLNKSKITNSNKGIISTFKYRLFDPSLTIIIY